MTTTSTLTPLEHLPVPTLDETPAAALRRLRGEVPEFREWFRRTGVVDGFASRSLVTLPYPTRFALWEASRSKLPYVWMTNRMMVVQWQEDGRTRTLVAEPTDYDLGKQTPFLQHSIRKLPIPDERAINLLFTEHGTVVERLAQLGIRPEDVDYLVFDHLHTQDVRRLIGTTGPAPDLGFPDGPVPAQFPNARLIVPRKELEHVRDVHPFQARFHQSSAYADIDESRLLLVDGSVLVAPGLALLRTPGHTLGNWTIVVNSPERGILTSSENGVAVECYSPAHSALPGVGAWAREWGYEVLLNFNTPEFASWQYNSMVVEKLLADPIPGFPHFSHVVPSSELTHHRLAPRIRPTYEHGELTLGRVGPVAK